MILRIRIKIMMTQPVQVDLHAYEQLRPRYAAEMIRHRTDRRVRLCEGVTLLFESRDTVLFQIHEVLRLEELRTEARAQQELEEYTPLLPAPGRIAASVFIDAGPSDRM